MNRAQTLELFLRRWTDENIDPTAKLEAHDIGLTLVRGLLDAFNAGEAFAQAEAKAETKADLEERVAALEKAVVRLDAKL